jgi:hypothetical protein
MSNASLDSTPGVRLASTRCAILMQLFLYAMIT